MPWPLAIRLHDQPAARALHPDVAVVLAAVQVAAALVLGNEGHEGIQYPRHGAGILARQRALCAARGK